MRGSSRSPRRKGGTESEPGGDAENFQPGSTSSSTASTAIGQQRISAATRILFTPRERERRRLGASQPRSMRVWQLIQKPANRYFEVTEDDPCHEIAIYDGDTVGTCLNRLLASLSITDDVADFTVQKVIWPGEEKDTLRITLEDIDVHSTEASTCAEVILLKKAI